MSVLPERKEKSNLVPFPFRMKKHMGKIEKFSCGFGLSLLSGHIPRTANIALEMVVYCQMEFGKHGIEYDSDFDFQKRLIQLVERYSKL